MRGGIDSRRRRILAGALGTALVPGFVLAQGQRDAAKNREIYLYKGADREKRILEGARKEREVVVYTSLNLKDSVPIVEVFERKYGVKVRLWRSSSEKVLQRAVAEARAGRFSCDILETNGPEMEAMHREELLEEFRSSSAHTSKTCRRPLFPGTGTTSPTASISSPSPTTQISSKRTRCPIPTKIC